MSTTRVPSLVVRTALVERLQRSAIPNRCHNCHYSLFTAVAQWAGSGVCSSGLLCTETRVCAVSTAVKRR